MTSSGTQTMQAFQADTLHLAERLIRFESTVDRPDQIAACVDTVQAFLKGGDLKLRLHERDGVPSLVITFTETQRPRVFLNGHVDVVPGRPEQFEPRLDGDRLYGRGALDMKAAVAAMTVLIKAYAERGERPDVGLMIVGDEEVGGANGTAHLIELGYDCEFFLAGEPTWLKIGNRAKGVAQVELVARGRPAHGARPWEGRSAIEVMMQAYPRLREVFPEARAPTDSLTASLTLIHSGDAVNRLPPECRLSLDVRYPTGAALAESLDRLRVVASELESMHTQLANPIETDEHHPYVEGLGQALMSAQAKPAAFMMKDAASDARFFAARGRPAVVFGPAGGGGHGDEEWVDLSSLATFQAVLDWFVRITC